MAEMCGNGFVLVAHHVARCYKPEIKSQGLHASVTVILDQS